MSNVTRTVDGYEITTSGSLVCPSPDLCDVQTGEKYEAYVERHCADHKIDLAYSPNAERNLGLNCGYFDHKYIWGNPTLTPQPFWELHAFVTQWEWNVSDLETDKPVSQRTFRIPPADKRGPAEYRRMKQVEVPRQSQKTSTGARWYSVFRSKREYFINDKSNYRIIIRSATGKNTRDTLSVIRRMASGSQKIKELYGVWMAHCEACSRTTQSAEKFTFCAYEDCRKKLRKPVRRVGLVNERKGAGAYGADMVSFRWLTNAEDADAVAAYSIWVAGLRSETTGQRPDLYIWDDPQTDTNSDTWEKRADINEKFDESVRQLEIPGEALVLDTRKYLDDFAGNIAKPPLSNLFFTLHRRVRWATTEANNPPHVVDGYRYYYPIKGDGKPALNKSEVDRLESQMVERKFSAEYMNDPLDPSKVLFKREHFKVITRDQAPPEVKYGLGRNVSEDEQGELDSLKVRIVAYNSCDPASKDEQSKKGDDSFIVGVRLDRWGALYVTRLQAGKWTASRTWREIEIANAYNRPYLTDYEMPSDEKHVRPSFEKYLRERQEELGQAPVIPMSWEHMPKTGKMGRIEQMETWTKQGNFYILADAADETLIEKYINQWVALGIADHDDGPDATARLLSRLRMHTYQAPPKMDEEPLITVSEAGEASVPVTLIKEMSLDQKVDGLWGETGW